MPLNIVISCFLKKNGIKILPRIDVQINNLRKVRDTSSVNGGKSHARFRDTVTIHDEE